MFLTWIRRLFILQETRPKSEVGSSKLIPCGSVFPSNKAGQGPVSLQYLQFWNRSSTKEVSLDKAALVVHRSATLVPHRERRIRFGIKSNKSFSILVSEEQKSRARVCNTANVRILLNVFASLNLNFIVWQFTPPWKRLLWVPQIARDHSHGIG